MFHTNFTGNRATIGSTIHQEKSRKSKKITKSPQLAEILPQTRYKSQGIFYVFLQIHTKSLNYVFILPAKAAILFNFDNKSPEK